MFHATPSSRPPATLVDAALPHLTAATLADWTPLTGGRTNRLWRVGDRVVKLYDPCSATPLFPNLPGAEYAALTCLAPRNLAPEPTTRLSGPFGNALIYRYVEGAPGYADPVALAHMLHRVHETPAMPGLRHMPSGSAAALAMTDALLAKVQTPDAGIVDLRRHLADQPAVPAEGAALIHADPVAANVVNTAGQPILIDWQCPAQGDPCEDLAIVLSPSMQRVYGASFTAAQTEEVLSAYPDRDRVARYRRLAPFLHLRMAAYAQWSSEHGRPSPPETIRSELVAARTAFTRIAG